jgi:hypothetical protein
MRWSALVAIVGLCGCAARGVDLDGRAVDPLAAAGVVALLFTSTGCPSGNRYAPEVDALYQRWRGRGVTFWLVYPDDDAAAVRAHRAAYALAPAALLDPRHALVRAAGATVTPEVALFAARRRLYLGRIDDRVLDFARERPAAIHHDLDDALAAVVAGRAPAAATTPAFGCAIGDPR